MYKCILIFTIFLLHTGYSQFHDSVVFRDGSTIGKRTDLSLRISEILYVGRFLNVDYRKGLPKDFDINVRVSQLFDQNHLYKEYFMYLVGLNHSIKYPLKVSLGISYSNKKLKEKYTMPVYGNNIRNHEYYSANLTIGEINYICMNTSLLIKETNSVYYSMDRIDYFSYWSLGSGYISTNGVAAEMGILFINNNMSAYISVGYNFRFGKN